MTRDDAIAILAVAELRRLSAAARAEQLEVMTSESWEDARGWSSLPATVRDEFERGELRDSPSSKRYDDVLLIWLRSGYTGATNDNIGERLAELRTNDEDVIGVSELLEACPCCGYANLGARGDYEICTVCWWEDDGQDNQNADIVMGGPNYHLSLTQARANFLAQGSSDPNRDDLRAHQAPTTKYTKRRIFELSPDRKTLNEKGSTWLSQSFSL